jgi:hypothetical protein
MWMQIYAAYPFLPTKHPIKNIHRGENLAFAGVWKSIDLQRLLSQYLNPSQGLL